ncbi:MAG: hypothetical protein ACOYEG_13460 [Petrimonas sp.]|jgi:hypothetical protein
MANEQNLIPNEMRTPEERRENARKAGIASGEARRKKKRMKELCDLVLNNKIQDERAVEGLRQRFPEIESDDITYELVLILKQYEKAKDGDSKAFELLRDTSGQKPVEKQEITNIDNKGFLKVVVDGIDISEDEK